MTRSGTRYSPARLKAPFELTSLRLQYDYDTMEKQHDIWDKSNSPYYEPSDAAFDHYLLHFIPYAKAKWEAHRAAFRSANDGVTFRGIVHVVRRDTQQYACIVDDDLPVEPEDTTGGNYDPDCPEPPQPTFGYDTIALRTPWNLDILRCCDDTYVFRPQLGLGFDVKNEEVLGSGDLVRTTLRATKMRLSFKVRKKAERNPRWPYLFTEGPPSSTTMFRKQGHSHDHTLIILRHFKELWRPALAS